MPQYFFHLCDGDDVILDSDGIELAGHEQVAAQAVAEARSILSHDVRQGRIDLRQRIEVFDPAGARVHMLEFVDAVEILGRVRPGLSRKG